jgi:hypothetical protein
MAGILTPGRQLASLGVAQICEWMCALFVNQSTDLGPPILNLAKRDSGPWGRQRFGTNAALFADMNEFAGTNIKWGSY